MKYCLSLLLFASLGFQAVFANANDDQAKVPSSLRRSLNTFNDPFVVQEDGVVVMEMESGAIAGDWKFETSVADYTGTGYYRMDGNTIQSGPPNGRVDFFFHVNTPGTYQLLLRTYKTNDDTTWENDCYTKMVGMAPVGYPNLYDKDVKTFQSGPSREWRWNTRHEVVAHTTYRPAVWDLTTGVHQLQISGRSKNFHIDRIVLYRTDDPKFGTGSIESEFDLNNRFESPRSSSIGSPGPTPSPTELEEPIFRGAPTDVPGYPASPNGVVSGELKKWHKVTIGFEGPWSDETASKNPFSDYRLDVTFEHDDGTTYTVPGYYAADGNAANTGATSGRVWLVHFAPDKEGKWSYEASFVTGAGVAYNGNSGTRTSFDGASGSFTIDATDKTGRDHRGKGRLQYVGEHHLQFAETGEWFLKAGADSPENFLAYEDFDNTPNNGGRRKSWAPHERDYKKGDPTWNDGKGTGIIGAINYLSDKGMNVFSFLPFSMFGDDKNVYPYISTQKSDRRRFDCSKLAQWEVLFEHADSIGMYLHFKTQERENDQTLDGGALGPERKMYYRELIARFSHHLALNWNMGEESTNTVQERNAFGQFFNQMDPYDHPLVVHTWPSRQEMLDIYGPLLGNNGYEGASIQCEKSKTFQFTKEWRDKSAAAGRKWVVANDEQGWANVGVVPDDDDPDHDEVRKDVLWGNIMAGGAGVEYYFGYSYSNSDMTCQDYRSRDTMWDQSRYALEFFRENEIPFWDMANTDSIVSNGWCLSDSSQDNFVVYLKDGGTATLDIDESASTMYTVKWFNPFSGGSLQDGSVTSINGGNNRRLGNSPSGPAGRDWVILIQRDPDGRQPDTPSPTKSPTKAPAASPTTEPPTKAPTAGEPFGAVTGLTLINAETDAVIRPFTLPRTIANMRNVGYSFAVRAETVGNVGSVGFALDDNDSYHVENNAPYAMAGNVGPEYYEVPELSVVGIYTLRVTPYSERNLQGEAGATFEVILDVRDRARRLGSDEE